MESSQKQPLSIHAMVVSSDSAPLGLLFAGFCLAATYLPDLPSLYPYPCACWTGTRRTRQDSLENTASSVPLSGSSLLNIYPVHTPVGRPDDSTALRYYPLYSVSSLRSMPPTLSISRTCSPPPSFSSLLFSTRTDITTVSRRHLVVHSQFPSPSGLDWRRWRAIYYCYYGLLAPASY